MSRVTYLVDVEVVLGISEEILYTHGRELTNMPVMIRYIRGRNFEMENKLQVTWRRLTPKTWPEEVINMKKLI